MKGGLNNLSLLQQKALQFKNKLMKVGSSPKNMLKDSLDSQKGKVHYCIHPQNQNYRKNRKSHCNHFIKEVLSSNKTL